MISAPTLSTLGLSSVSPATRSKWQASEDGAERQRLGEGCEGGGADRDLDHAGDMGPARRQKKAPRIGRAARGEVGGPREIATQRCDSATPSFIPPLNAKRAARSLYIQPMSRSQSLHKPAPQSSPRGEALPSRWRRLFLQTVGKDKCRRLIGGMSRRRGPQRSASGKGRAARPFAGARAPLIA